MTSFKTVWKRLLYILFRSSGNGTSIFFWDLNKCLKDPDISQDKTLIINKSLTYSYLAY